MIQPTSSTGQGGLHGSTTSITITPSGQRGLHGSTTAFAFTLSSFLLDIERTPDLPRPTYADVTNTEFLSSTDKTDPGIIV